MQEGFRKFVEHTTIHGVKDILHAKTFFWKLVWLILFLISACCMFFFIFETSLDSRGEPTMTKMSWLKQDFYETPPISFCPTIWINETKARSLGLTAKELNYLQPEQSLQAAINLNAVEFEVYSEQIFRAMFLTETVSISTLYRSLALNPKAVISCKVCTNVSKLYQMYQICYKIDYGPLPSQSLNSNGTTYVTYKNVYRSLVEFSGRLIIGEGVFSQAIVNGINSRPGHMNIIQVSSKQIIQLSKRNEPCSETESADNIASLDIARMNCYSQKVTEAIFCRYCFGFEKTKNVRSENYTEWYKNGTITTTCEKCSLENEDEFENKCLIPDFVPPCKRWVFEYTFNTEAMSKAGESRTDFVITFAPIYGVEVLEEVLKYTWDSFLSNIGGQLGLWLGASFLSCFQAIYYMCIEPCMNGKCNIANSMKQFVSKHKLTLT